MLRLVVVFCALPFLAACAAGPRELPLADVEPIDLHSADLAHYWVARNASIRVPPPLIRVECGHTIQQVVIGSDGRIRDLQVLGAVPDERLSGYMVRVFAGQEYRPARTNPQRTPVRVRLLTTISTEDGAECSAPEFEELAARRHTD